MMLGAAIMEPFGIYLLSWLAYFTQHGVLKLIHVVAHAKIFFFFSQFPLFCASVFYMCGCRRVRVHGKVGRFRRGLRLMLGITL